MAKKKAGVESREGGEAARSIFERQRDYFVYWSSGLKSRVHGLSLERSLPESVLRVVDAQTGDEVYLREG